MCKKNRLFKKNIKKERKVFLSIYNENSFSKVILDQYKKEQKKS